eukprot:m.169313 g.169313  ORF g.169313 m.169313 type:complete len:365 (+) comp38984_c0_seq1:2049-3143(+)
MATSDDSDVGDFLRRWEKNLKEGAAASSSRGNSRQAPTTQSNKPLPTSFQRVPPPGFKSEFNIAFGNTHPMPPPGLQQLVHYTGTPPYPFTYASTYPNVGPPMRSPFVVFDGCGYRNENAVSEPHEASQDSVADIAREHLLAKIEEEEEKVETLQEEKKRAEANVASLVRVLDVKTSKIGNLKSERDDLWMELEEAKKEICQLKEERKAQLEENAAEKGRSLEEMKKLREQAAFLEKEKSDLEEEVNDLKKEMAQMESDNGDLKNDLVDLTQSNETLMRSNEILESDLKVASDSQCQKPVADCQKSNCFEAVVERLQYLFPIFDRGKIISFIGMCRSSEGSLAGLSAHRVVTRVAKFIAKELKE